MADAGSKTKESLWLLERADNLLHEIAAAVWLSLASMWRIPMASVRKDSIVRMEALIAERRILPPRLAMLIASITTALLMAWVLPPRIAHQTAGNLMSKLTSASPENWLLVAAPALISLWLTVVVCGALLRVAAGWKLTRATDLLMHVVAASLLLNCAVSYALFWWDWDISAWRAGLTDDLFLYGRRLLTVFLCVAGVRCASQLSDANGHTAWRRLLLFILSPLIFAAAANLAIVATYWATQGNALVLKTMATGRLPEMAPAMSPKCTAEGGAVICQVLLLSTETIAVGTLRQIDFNWQSKGGGTEKVELFSHLSQVTQLSPSAPAGGFWPLRANELQPFSFQIATADACRLSADIESEKKSLEQRDGITPEPVTVYLWLYWRTGFALQPREDAAVIFETVTEQFADPKFDEGLAQLCAAERK
jgi:hypothetical protein